MATNYISEEENSGTSYQRRRVNLSTVEDTFLLRLTDLLKVYSAKVVVACLIVGFIVSFLHYSRPEYRAKALLSVQRAENSPIQAMMAKMTGNPILNGRKPNEYLEKYLYFLNSHEFFMAAARELLNRKSEIANRFKVHRSEKSKKLFSLSNIFYSHIEDVSKEESSLEDLTSFLNGIASFKKSGVDNISVQVITRKYRDSVELANFLAETAVGLITGNEVKELTEAKDYISNQLAITEARLGKIDAEIIEFRKKNGIVKSDGAGREAIEKNYSLKTNLDSTQLKYAQNEKLINLLSDEIKAQESILFQYGASHLGTAEVSSPIRQQIQSLKYKRLQLLSQGYAENSELVVQTNQEIDDAARQLKSSIQKNGGTENDFTAAFYDKEGTVKLIESLQLENQFLSASINTLQKALKESNKPLESIPETQQKLQTFQRNTQIEAGLLQEMRKRILEIELEKVALNSKVSVLEKATIGAIEPRLNIFPKLLVAILITLFVVTVIIFGVDELNQSVKKRSQLEEVGISVIGNVPMVSYPMTLGIQRLFPSLFRKKFNVTNVLNPWKNELESPEVMAFKHVRAAALKIKKRSDGKGSLVAILGPRQRDGKSFVACNFALSIAQLKLKTLLIDGDLRKSTVGAKLGIAEGLGLSDLLLKKATLDTAISKEVMPFLDVIPAGTIVKGITELLSGGLFAQYLEELRSRYDFVVIDTPPVLPVVDALIVANLADIVLMTVSHRQTKIRDIEQAVQKFNQVSDKPLYGIYNRVEGLYEYLYVQNREVDKTPKGPSSINVKTEIDKFKRSLKNKTAGDFSAT